MYRILYHVLHYQLIHTAFHIIAAEPIVRGEISHLPEGSVFIYCQVGQRD